MLKAIGEFLAAKGLQSGNEDSGEDDLRLATALLLVEIARADHSFDEQEKHSIVRILSEHFSLSESEVTALLQTAEGEADDVAHLQGFTRRLNEELDYDGKKKIVAMLWQVAFADNELSKFEDSLVRRLADLLYVSHSDQIRLRNEVRDRLSR